MTILIYAGEWITTTGGEKIAKCLRDIQMWERIRYDDDGHLLGFTDWQLTPPSAGSPIRHCIGKDDFLPWARDWPGHIGGIDLHTERGWMSGREDHPPNPNPRLTELIESVMEIEE